MNIVSSTHSSAALSPCGLYRYTLSRVWDTDLPGVLWLMLNPSRADASQDDPTIRRCLRYARAWGHGSITVVNLFAFRATDPACLLTAADPVGPDNDRHIQDQIDRHSGHGDYIVCAWGANAARPEVRPRRNAVRRILPVADVLCLDTTASGEPKHPLYCSSSLGPVQYECTASQQATPAP